MVSALSLAALLVLVAAHTLLSAVLTRYFRIALDTAAGAALFAVAGIPLVLVASTLVLSGVLGLGPDLGNPALVFVLLVAAPLALGGLVDVLYVPPPEAYEMPGDGAG